MKIKTKISAAIILTTFIISIISAIPVYALPTTGKFGNALDFDGDDDYVIVHDSDCLDISHFTLEAWIYPRSFPNTWPRIIHKTNYELDLFVTDTNLAVNIGPGNTPFYSDTNIITLDEWQHVAVTFNGTHVTFYRNGIPVGQWENTITAQPDTSDLYIGNRPGLDRDFDGLIDEVRISNFARDDFDLDYAPTNDAGTVGLWHFDEGTGKTAFDAAFDETYPCKDDGTIVGATWVTEGFTLFFEGAAPEDVIIDIVDPEDLPSEYPCAIPLPEGFGNYFAVEVVGSFEGMVTVAVNYDDAGMDDSTERGLKLYMADCVDFNGDRTVNGIDLSLIKKAIKAGTAETDDPPNPAISSYDVNGDGFVDELDVAIVKEYMSHGLIVNQGKDGMPQARLQWIDITTWVDIENNIIDGETGWFSLFRCR